MNTHDVRSWLTGDYTEFFGVSWLFPCLTEKANAVPTAQGILRLGVPRVKGRGNSLFMKVLRQHVAAPWPSKTGMLAECAGVAGSAYRGWT
jgi:hypothetical protein